MQGWKGRLGMGATHVPCVRQVTARPAASQAWFYYAGGFGKHSYPWPSLRLLLLITTVTSTGASANLAV